MRLNLLRNILVFIAMNLFLSIAASAVAPAITITEPAASTAYVWADFILNATTDINANCTYAFTYTSNGSVAASGSLDSVSLIHNTSISISSLPAGYNYTINVTCMNATDAAEMNTSLKTVLRDYTCGSRVHSSWVLGHNLSCNGYALNITTAGVVLDCNNNWIVGNFTSTAGHGILINPSGTDMIGTVIRNCNIENFTRNIWTVSGSSGTWGLIINSSRIGQTFYSSSTDYGINCGSNGTTIQYNTFTGNYSLQITGPDNLVQHNLFNKSDNLGKTGIFIEGIGNVTIYNNTFTGYNASGSAGIWLQYLTDPYVKIYKNKFLVNYWGVYSYLNTYYDINYNNMGNYWGQSSCPAFYTATVGYTNTNITDYFPYKDSDFEDADRCVSCGANLISSINLNGDIYCNGTGLYISSSGVTLNCSGKSLAGNGTIGSLYGIYVGSGIDNTAIMNCNISRFAYSIYLESNNDGNQILNNNITDSSAVAISLGIFSGGDVTSANSIIGNTIRGGERGIDVGGSRNSNISNNNLSDLSYGIRFLANGNNDNNTLSHNQLWRLGIGLWLGGTFTNSNLVNNTVGHVNTTAFMLNSSVSVPANVSFINNTVINASKGFYACNSSGNGNPITGLDFHGNTINATDSGIMLNDTVISPLVYHNNFIGAYASYKLYSTNALYADYNSQGNFWGRTSCPVFVAETDANTGVVDRFGYNLSNAWLTGSPADCNVLTINLFTDIIRSRANYSFGYSDSMAGYALLHLWINVSNTSITAPTGVSVNLTDVDGICQGFLNPQPLNFSGDGIFNISCTVLSSAADGTHIITANAYLLNGMKTASANFTLFKDTAAPRVRFSWWNTTGWNQSTNASYAITLPYFKNFTGQADIFFSNNERNINFTLNVSDAATTTISAVSYVQINFSDFDSNAFAKKGTCTGVHNMTLANNVARYNCTIDSFTADDWGGEGPVESYDVNFYVFDNFGNSPATYNTSDPDASICSDPEAEGCMPATTPINLQDIGVPEPPNEEEGECYRIDASASTNFSTEDDFTDVNLLLAIEFNMSNCYGGDPILPSDFIRMILFNFTSLDFSSPEAGVKLGMLIDAIGFEIASPKTFGQNRIYVDTDAFTELDSNATIILSSLPFASEPAIISDADAEGVLTHSWVSNGYDSRFNAITGNLTFNVSGFSGYNVSDNSTPIITVNSPVQSLNTTNSSIFVNVTVNGTGTAVSNVIIAVDGINNSWSAEDFNCTAIAQGSDTYNCLYNATINGDGNHTINISGWDYGGETGNSVAGGRAIRYDITAPTITITMPLNSSYTNGTINFTASDAISALHTCRYLLSNGSNDTTTCNQGFSLNLVDGTTYNLTLFANDTLGNLNSGSVLNFIADKTAPSVFLMAPAANATVNSSTTPNFYFNATDSLSSTLSCNLFWGGTNAGNQTFTGVSNNTEVDAGYLSAVLNENITWNVSCTDIAGNTNISASRWFLVNDTTAPVISGGSPSGALASSTTSASLSVTTDESTTCRYSTSDLAYVNLTGSFTDSATTHTTTYSVSAGNSYVFYVRCSDISNNSNNASTIISFSVAAATSSSSGGGGGGGTITTNPQTSRQWNQIPSGVLQSVSVTDAQISISQISFTLSANADNSKMIIELLPSKPNEASASDGEVYKYLKITNTNIADSLLSGTAKIKFKVSKAWLTSKGITPDKVVLKRYSSSSWIELTTNKLSEDINYAYYESETPGFSYFLIGTKAAPKTTTPAAPVNPVINISADNTPPAETVVVPEETAKPSEENKTKEPANEKKADWKLIGKIASGVIVVALAAVFIVLLFNSRKKKPLPLVEYDPGREHASKPEQHHEGHHKN